MMAKRRHADHLANRQTDRSGKKTDLFDLPPHNTRQPAPP
jgi:hypothetical protein